MIESTQGCIPATQSTCGVGIPPDPEDAERKIKEHQAKEKVMSELEDPEDRIVNGYEAGSVPWYVGLAEEEGNPLQVVCGGAIINSRYVV